MAPSKAFLSDLHTHTTFSDGADTPEKMVRAAIDMGYESLGFSEHSPIGYDTRSQIRAERLPDYFSEIERLKREYAGTIEIYAGIESDAMLVLSDDRLDYTIGSVHFLRNESTGRIYCVDYTEREFEEAIIDICGGDIRELVRAYYRTAGDMLESYRPDIAGHIDSIVKLNKNSRYFDENSAWYKKAQEDIAEKMAAAGCVVEVNTGGIRRGYRELPYPSGYMLGILRELKVPLTLSSDAHRAEDMGFWFKEAAAMLKKLGFKSVKQLVGGVWADKDI